MTENRSHRLFEDIGSIKATQKAILQGQKRIEQSLNNHDSRIRRVEGQTGRLLALAGCAAVFISTLLNSFLRWLHETL